MVWGGPGAPQVALMGLGASDSPPPSTLTPTPHLPLRWPWAELSHPGGPGCKLALHPPTHTHFQLHTPPQHMAGPGKESALLLPAPRLPAVRKWRSGTPGHSSVQDHTAPTQPGPSLHVQVPLQPSALSPKLTNKGSLSECPIFLVGEGKGSLHRMLLGFRHIYSKEIDDRTQTDSIY